MTNTHTSRHCSLPVYAVSFLFLAACTPPGNERPETPDTLKAPEQQTELPELRELFAQKYIDPLSDYIKSNSGKAEKAEAVKEVKTERMKRCRRVAARYHRRAKNSANLEKLTRGYQYSCPQVVTAFAALVKAGAGESGMEKSEAAQKGAVPGEAAEETGAESAGLFMPEGDDELMTWDEVEKDFIFSCEDAFAAGANKEVLRLCTAPAARGDAQAQYFLGKTYAEEEHIRGNLEEAFIWLNLAVRGGLQKAAVLRDKIGGLLNPAEHIKAQHRAMEIAGSY